MNTTIGVTTSFIGFHRWANAPEHRRYLASAHRHKFGVKVELLVTEHDREVEYHDLLDVVALALPDDAVRSLTDNPFMGFSCEHHAARIGRYLTRAFPGRAITVTVDEDGECFSSVTLP